MFKPKTLIKLYNWYTKYSKLNNWNISYQLVPFVFIYKKLTHKPRKYIGPPLKETQSNETNHTKSSNISGI